MAVPTPTNAFPPPIGALRPPPAATVARDRGQDRYVHLAVALGYVMLLPQQFSVMAFGSVIPPYRFFLIAATLFVIATGLRGRWRMILPDYLMLFGVGWICLALYNTTEFSDFVTSAVSQTTDIGMAYFFGRITIQSLRDLRLFLLLMLPGLAVMGATIAVESILHKHLLQPLVGELTGIVRRYPVDTRMGLMRARGPFPHPILAGAFFASFLPLYWMSGIRGWPRIVGIVTSFSAVFTVSSAAMLALSVSSGLMIYNWLSDRISNLSWRMFFIVLSIVVFFLEFATKSGSFNLIMRYASLNSDSAFNRVLIWRYGTDNVVKNPWFGIGYADWERPSWMFSGSIDHYWLINAIQFGIIPPMMMAIVTLMAIVGVVRQIRGASFVDRRALIGLAIAMAVFAFGVISVSLWLSVQVWFHMLMGVCIGIGHAAVPRKMVPLRRAHPGPLAAPSLVSGLAQQRP